MICKYCGGYTKVIETRTDKSGTYRRNRCLNCDKTIFTEEHDMDAEKGREHMNYIHKLTYR